MSSSIFDSTNSLIKLKLRILRNTFFKWGSIGKGLLSISGALVIAYIISITAKDLIPALQTMLFGEEAIQWVVSIIIIYFAFVTFTADMVTGHTLNTGQVSSDFKYLVTLPIPPMSIVFIKIFERLVTDYIGFLFIFSGFVGIIFRNSISFSGFILALALYLQVSLLIGLTINVTILFLKRFFRTSTVNNFFSLFGYFSAFFTLIPYLLISNKPIVFAKWLLFNLSEVTTSVGFIGKPFYWLSGTLLSCNFDSNFFMFTLSWLIIAIIGIAIFAILIKFNWHTYSHSASKQIIKSEKRLFSGIFQKEILLLKSDYNLLINAILMPISIIILEIYFLKKAVDFSIFSHSLNLVFGAIIYFCMFGPVNSIGAEGKSINYLESLPISPSKLLNQKMIFWLIIAETLFMPASIIAMRTLNFSWYFAGKAALNTFFFVSACIWVSISISAIFARYETKILQQRSTFLGKVAAFTLMLFAAPIKDFSTNSIAFAVIFLTLGATVRLFAIGKIFSRLDTLYYQRKNPLWGTFFISVMFFAVNFSINYLLTMAVSQDQIGLIPWFISVIIFIPAIFLFSASHLSKQNSKFYKYLKISIPKTIALLSVSIIAICFIKIISIIFSHQGKKITLWLSDLINFISSFGITDTTSAIMLIIMVAIALVLLETLLHGFTIQSDFMKNNPKYSFIFISLLSSLFFPGLVIIPAILYSLVSNGIYLKWKNLSLNYVFAVLFSTISLIMIVWQQK